MSVNNPSKAASSLACSSLDTARAGTKNKSLPSSFASGTMQRNLNNFLSGPLCTSLNLGLGRLSRLQTSWRSCDGNFCHWATDVLPFSVTLACSATIPTCPLAPFCLCPFPPHCWVSGSHLWPRLGRSGRFPQSHWNGWSQLHLEAAAVVALLSVFPFLAFPIFELK